jgi:hypothetical protein
MTKQFDRFAQFPFSWNQNFQQIFGNEFLCQSSAAYLLDFTDCTAMDNTFGKVIKYQSRTFGYVLAGVKQVAMEYELTGLLNFMSDYLPQLIVP